MHRDPRLRPFSRDHHHVLALARRLERAPSWDQLAAQDLSQRVQRELSVHFAHEAELFGAALEAAGNPTLARELRQRHHDLLTLARHACRADLGAARAFGAALVHHVRWEERELFPWCEENLPDAVLEQAAAAPLVMQRADDRAPLPTLAPAPALSEEVLRRVVDTFYARVRDDDLLGPVFASAVHDWPAHLKKLTHFWSRVMLGTQDYSGNPMIAHAQHRDRITQAHFERWLSLWRHVTGELLAAPLAAELQERAGRMAMGLGSALFGGARARALLRRSE